MANFTPTLRCVAKGLAVKIAFVLKFFSGF